MVDNIKIISVDPGSNFIGVSIFTIDGDTLEINDIDNVLIDLSGIETKKNIEPLLRRLFILKKTITELAIEHRPHIISIENAFINRLRPAAYGPLSKSILAIEFGVLEAGIPCLIRKYPPMEIKKAISNKGNADKDAVRESVAGIDELNSNIDLSRLSEHEVDSIAIGYIALMNVRKHPNILITI